MPPLKYPYLEDDRINGAVVDKTASDTTRYIENEPKYSLRDKILDFAIKKEKVTRADIFVNVSGSGSAHVIIASFIQAGVFLEHFFDCNNCKYYTVDKSKVIKT